MMHPPLAPNKAVIDGADDKLAACDGKWFFYLSCEGQQMVHKILGMKCSWTKHNLDILHTFIWPRHTFFTSQPDTDLLSCWMFQNVELVIQKGMWQKAGDWGIQRIQTISCIPFVCGQCCLKYLPHSHSCSKRIPGRLLPFLCPCLIIPVCESLRPWEEMHSGQVSGQRERQDRKLRCLHNNLLRGSVFDMTHSSNPRPQPLLPHVSGWPGLSEGTFRPPVKFLPLLQYVCLMGTLDLNVQTNGM